MKRATIKNQNRSLVVNDGHPDVIKAALFLNLELFWIITAI